MLGLVKALLIVLDAQAFFGQLDTRSFLLNKVHNVAEDATCWVALLRESNAAASFLHLISVDLTARLTNCGNYLLEFHCWGFRFLFVELSKATVKVCSKPHSTPQRCLAADSTISQARRTHSAPPNKS